jgi:beta-barrel assembly-enhancing protease
MILKKGSIRVAKAAAAVLASLLLLSARSAQPAWATALQRYDRRLITLSYQIATANVAYCSEKKGLLGLSIHDLSQYPLIDQDVVATTYPFVGYPLVLSVARNGPADIGGIQPGDSIAAINGVSVPRAASRARSYERVSAVWQMLDNASSEGEVRLSLIRGASVVQAMIRPVMGCGTRFELGSSERIDAETDDANAIVNVGALEFAHGDDEAAAIVAHELAHDILHHRQKIASSPRSERRAVAQRAEEEADQLSVQLLKNAGFAPEAIIHFWQRFLTEFPKSPNKVSLQKRLTLVGSEIGDAGAVGRPSANPDAFMHDSAAN